MLKIKKKVNEESVRNPNSGGRKIFNEREGITSEAPED